MSNYQKWTYRLFSQDLLLTLYLSVSEITMPNLKSIKLLLHDQNYQKR